MPSPSPAPAPDPAARRQLYVSVAIVVGLVGVLILYNALLHRPSARWITYDQFHELVATGKVASCRIGRETIQGKLTGPVALRLDPESSAETEVSEFLAVRIEDPDLISVLELAEIRYEGAIESDGFLGTLLIFFFLPICLVAVIIGGTFLMMRRLTPQQASLSFGKSRAKIYAETETRITFGDVAGIDEAKDELREIIEFLRDPARFKRLGGRIPRGVLLLGAPGTGKTLLAKAVAGESGVPFFSMSGSDFVEMFAGVGAARVRDLFKQAGTNAPCIVFIDEIDALGKQRGMALSGSHDEREQTLNQLLAELDGFDDNDGVILLAATNRPEILDPALLRPGRFDRQVVVDRPDLPGRIAILEVHARKATLSDGVDLEVIARRTPGFVGADLANVINEAALLAARRGGDGVTMADLEEAIDRTVAGLERKRRVMNPKEKERVAFHEAGHALVAASIDHADPVHRISIIPRGVAALGYTMQLPTEDRYLMTRRELEARIAVALGGRAAEDLIYGELSTGAADDLRRVVEIARRMVREYGMTERFGPLVFDPGPRTPFLEGAGAVDPAPRGYSEQTAREIDTEVAAIIDREQQRVREILADREAVLRATADRLMEREVVEQDELLAILREHGFEPSERAQTRPGGSERGVDDGAPEKEEAPAEEPSAAETKGAGR